MTTRTELRALVRGELNDDGAVLLWPNDRLDQWLAEGIRDYGRDLPRQAAVELASVAGQAAYALPADVLRVVRVEHPEGVVRVASADVDVPGYEVFAGELVLAPAPTADGQPIAVRYMASYAEPTADAEPLATPSSDDQLLVWYVCWRALGWLSTDEAKRQRFERQRGASAGSEAQRYLQLYTAAVFQRRRPYVVRG